MTPRKRLTIERLEGPLACLSSLRIESLWNKRSVIVLDEDEVRELAVALPLIFPEHFPAVEVRVAGEPTYAPPEESA